MRSVVLIVMTFTAASAYAYVGPGLGLGVIGVLLGVILAVFLAVAGFIWYPIKRMLWRPKPASDNTEETDGHAPENRNNDDRPEQTEKDNNEA